MCSCVCVSVYGMHVRVFVYFNACILYTTSSDSKQRPLLEPLVVRRVTNNDGDKGSLTVTKFKFKKIKVHALLPWRYVGKT